MSCWLDVIRSSQPHFCPCSRRGQVAVRRYPSAAVDGDIAYILFRISKLKSRHFGATNTRYRRCGFGPLILNLE